MLRRLMVVSATAFILASVTTPSAAVDDVPQYDIRRYCASNFGNYTDKSQNFLLENCISTETDKQRKLSRVWHRIPTDIHRTCSAQMSAFKEGSYILLSSCALSLYATRWFENGGVVE